MLLPAIIAIVSFSAFMTFMSRKTCQVYICVNVIVWNNYKRGQLKRVRFIQYSATLVFLVGRHLELVSRQPRQKVVDGRLKIISHWRQPNCFY